MCVCVCVAWVVSMFFVPGFSLSGARAAAPGRSANTKSSSRRLQAYFLGHAQRGVGAQWLRPSRRRLGRIAWVCACVRRFHGRRRCYGWPSHGRRRPPTGGGGPMRRGRRSRQGGGDAKGRCGFPALKLSERKCGWVVVRLGVYRARCVQSGLPGKIVFEHFAEML